MSDDNGFLYAVGRGWDTLHNTEDTDSDTEPLEYEPEDAPYHIGTPYTPATAWKMSRAFRNSGDGYRLAAVFECTTHNTMVRVSCTGETLTYPCICTIDSEHHEWRFLGYFLYKNKEEVWRMLFFQTQDEYNRAYHYYHTPQGTGHRLWESNDPYNDFVESYTAPTKCAGKM